MNAALTFIKNRRTHGRFADTITLTDDSIYFYDMSTSQNYQVINDIVYKAPLDLLETIDHIDLQLPLKPIDTVSDKHKYEYIVAQMARELVVSIIKVEVCDNMIIIHDRYSAMKYYFFGQNVYQNIDDNPVRLRILKVSDMKYFDGLSKFYKDTNNTIEHIEQPIMTYDFYRSSYLEVANSIIKCRARGFVKQSAQLCDITIVIHEN